MSLVRTFSLALILVFSIYGESAFSYAYGSCNSVNDRSCWHAINTTENSVTVDCNEGEFRANLVARQTYSHQFDLGWGDGLGYPEPNTHYKCNVGFLNGEVVVLSFDTLNWGDRVQIMIQTEGVIVNLKSYWNHQERNYYFPLAL